jgi:hypothetical protein
MISELISRLSMSLDLQDMAIGGILMLGFILLMILSLVAPDDWN